MDSALRNRIKILIVDDVPSARLVIRKLLQNLGFSSIVEAESGSAAISILLRKQFSLVISDWNMPNLGGLELLKHIRSKETLKNLPFIMVTSTAAPELILASAKAGTTDFIVKPFSSETLEMKIIAIGNNLKPVSD
jgi:two-component system chemotaxis response regulator CheY